MARLKRVSCSTPGIARRRRGKGWSYHDQRTGEKIDDPETLQRISDLAIPPAWKDVWICAAPNGHLQAVGVDAAGRKQYRYHERWRQRRDAEKFEKMIAFAKRLPALRERAAAGLARHELDRERVLSCGARLLDHGFFRIGGEQYAEANDSYGLATMRREHVRVEGDVVVFEYAAKAGKERLQSIADPEVCAVVTELKERDGGGDELLAYCEDGDWRDVRSADINEWIKDACGEEFSAKDFRTWNATVLAALGLAVSRGSAGSKTARKRAEVRVVKEVAHYLGNTPAVCRKSYIDPRVFDRFHAGHVVNLDRLGEGVEFGQPLFQGAIEEAVLDLLGARYDEGTVDDVEDVADLAEAS